MGGSRLCPVFGVWGLLWFGGQLAAGWQLHAAGALAVVRCFAGGGNWDAISSSSGHRSLIKAAIALALIVTLWALLWGGRRLGGAQLAWACLALVAFELLLFAPHKIYRDRHDTFSEPPYVQFLQDQQSGDEWPRMFALDALLFPNSASAYDLHDIRDLDALYPERFIPYLRAFVSPEVTDRFVGGPFASLEGAAQVAGNPLFDLTGVEYVVTGPGGLARALPNSIIDEVVSDAGSSLQINRTSFNIDGVEKPVLFAHPPSEVAFQVTPTPETPVLRFSLALSPESWSNLGDGVTFEVAIGESVSAPAVVKRTVDPKSNPADRRWFDEALDLSDYLGQDVTVRFRTLPDADALADWSGWGDPRLTGATAPEGASGQFQLVYDDEARVYRNSHAFPRAFAVHEVRAVADGEAALALMREDDFDPSRMAVVEGSAPPLPPAASGSAPGPNDSDVQITKYRDNRVELSARMDAAGMVLLTDTYYPGWKAYVDGKRTELYEADYLFRGVSVPEGEHQIEFVYDPVSFKVGAALSLLAIVCLLAMVAIDLYTHRARHRAGGVNETSDERPAASEPLF